MVEPGAKVDCALGTSCVGHAGMIGAADPVIRALMRVLRYGSCTFHQLLAFRLLQAP